MERLGQHFLKNDRVVKLIVDSLSIGTGETIVEIGPGGGALTLPLEKICEKNGGRLIAVEKDERLAAMLEKKFRGKDHVTILKGDIRKLLPKIAAEEKKWKLVGNIPYYLTGYLLRLISELPEKPAFIVLMVQKEVAERITARPPKMNLLGAIIRHWANPEIIIAVERESFEPPPEVDSAVIRLIPQKTAGQSEPYFAFVKKLFRQPRKTILNNLRSGGFGEEKVKRTLADRRILPEKRPQDLTLEEIEFLSAALAE